MRWAFLWLALLGGEVFFAYDAMPLTVSVVRFAKIISIFVVSMGLTARRQTYLKVFSHCPSKRI